MREKKQSTFNSTNLIVSLSYEAILNHSDLSLLLLSQNLLQDKMAFGSLGGRFRVLGGGILFVSPGAMTLSPWFLETLLDFGAAICGWRTQGAPPTYKERQPSCAQ